MKFKSSLNYSQNTADNAQKVFPSAKFQNALATTSFKNLRFLNNKGNTNLLQPMTISK